MSQFSISQSAPDIWENEGGAIRPLSYAESIGVTRILTETFRVRGYSYTSLADAIAQARRLGESRAKL